jgi:quercetin dioxygenase-like cupin family protein
MPDPGGRSALIELSDLPHTEHAHEFVGAEHGDVPFSIILVHTAPGTGPRVHRHPYPEVFVVESGQATFQLGDDEIVAHGGQIAVAPTGVPHGFTNSGSDELRLTAIHGAAAFNTEWLTGLDQAWSSKPKRG